MNKKLFVLILAVMVVSMAACGGQKDPAPAAEPTPQSTTGNTAPYREPEQPTVEQPVGEDTTWPEIEFDWEPAAPSGSFDATEPSVDEPAPEQSGGTNTEDSGKTEEPTEETTERETSPAERDGVTGNYTPWG